MKITEYTDYTLRTLIFLGLHRDERVTIQDIAEGYGISKNHLMKIIHQLGQDGVIETVRGRGGGVTLRMAPEDIRIGAIVRASEPDFALVECFDRGHNRCVISPVCRLQGGLREALDAFFRVLDGLTLADILHNAEDIAAYVPLPHARVTEIRTDASTRSAAEMARMTEKPGR
jgi:Rrf2 family transcriptional regulator, nitric oxide-sensitive transcriptional repressor